MLARDVMTPEPVTLSAHATLREALRIFAQRNFRHLPVLDEEGKLQGMVSDRDLRPFDPDRFPGSLHADTMRAFLDLPVDPFAAESVVFVRPEDDIAEVMAQLINHRLGAVPVADAEGNVVGIISYIDLLTALQKKL